MKVQEKLGKLISVDLTTINGKISKLIISGDFFLYPEEKILELEKSLTGLDGSISEKDLTSIIQKKLENSLLVGVEPSQLAKLIKRAIACGD